jgi:hypothetical protein
MTLSLLHHQFVTIIKPVVERWARANFRDDEQVAEAVGMSWKWFLSLSRRGKDGTRFPGAIARRAVCAVRAGRRVVRSLSARDALSTVAQQRHGFTVSRLPDYETLSVNPFTEALAEHGQADPADHAAFRCDWPRFLNQQSERDVRMAEQLGMGEKATVVAGKIGVSPGRLTQLRQRLMRRWHEFHGEAA